MTVKVISATSGEGDTQPWHHWHQDVFGDWKANFYNTTEPYLRHRRMVTGCGPNAKERLAELRAEVDAEAAADGLVPFDKLPALIQEYWAEADSMWLLAEIARHLGAKSA